MEKTKRMEGNNATGSLVIAEYYDLLTHLTVRCDHYLMGDALLPMLNTMRIRIQRYFDEALVCRPYVMAALLNPHFRISLFEAAFGDTTRPSDQNRIEHARSLFQAEFIARKTKLDRTKLGLSNPANKVVQGAGPTSTPSISARVGGIFALNKSKQTSVVPDEVIAYFDGEDPLHDQADARNPIHMLSWWKVSFPFITIKHSAFLI